jgi:methyl-accepting chemotaxis protein WspA
MTIGKKLYLGFGAILAIMLVLFIVNIFTVRREYNARATVRDTLANVQTIEAVRLQMMSDRLFLGNYLLSGDLRDEDRTNKGVNDLLATLKDAESKVTDTNLRAALSQVDENERGWSENFAKPMMAKRHQVGHQVFHRARRGRQSRPQISGRFKCFRAERYVVEHRNHHRRHLTRDPPGSIGCI